MLFYMILCLIIRSSVIGNQVEFMFRMVLPKKKQCDSEVESEYLHLLTSMNLLTFMNQFSKNFMTIIRKSLSSIIRNQIMIIDTFKMYQVQNHYNNYFWLLYGDSIDNDCDTEWTQCILRASISGSARYLKYNFIILETCYILYLNSIPDYIRNSNNQTDDFSGIKWQLQQWHRFTHFQFIAPFIYAA